MARTPRLKIDTHPFVVFLVPYCQARYLPLFILFSFFFFSNSLSFVFFFPPTQQFSFFPPPFSNDPPLADPSFDFQDVSPPPNPTFFFFFLCGYVLSLSFLFLFLVFRNLFGFFSFYFYPLPPFCPKTLFSCPPYHVGCRTLVVFSQLFFLIVVFFYFPSVPSS